jgi:pyruvate dehydrogenase E1 component alpha subunit
MTEYGKVNDALKDTALGRIPKAKLISIYRMMLKIRLTEERIGELVRGGKIGTPCHLCIGQEASAASVCADLRDGDFVFSNHRSHGHYLAKGGSLRGLMAEIFGKKTGCSGGLGGSMHLCDPSKGLMGSSAIVGGTIPLAAGAALNIKIRGDKSVVVSFFGDGATNEGVLYESLNFASLRRLPLIFVCENNFYSTHMHISKIQSVRRLSEIGRLFNIPARRVNGYDPVSVYNLSRDAIIKARKGEGPCFIEALTYRWRGHVGPDWDLDKPIRTKKEVDSWVMNCGVDNFEKLLFKKSVLTENRKKAIIKDLKRGIDDAVRYAKRSGFPAKSILAK